MAHLAGKSGNVYSTTAGGTATGVVIVAGMKSWNVDYTSDALDSTDFADGATGRTYIAGLSGWSGSFEGFKDGAAGLTPGTSYILHLRESASTTTQLYTGTALITGLHESASVDGIVGLSYDFQGSGALTSA